jgi:acetoin utilization deacetylase AcuC-like enzyme
MVASFISTRRQKMSRRRLMGLLGVAASGLAAMQVPRPTSASPSQAQGDRAPLPLFYSPDYVLAGHTFETTRKAGWVADSLAREPIPGVEIVAPTPLTAEQVAEVHAPRYVEAVRTGQPRALAESQGFRWDPGLWTMVLASNGGAVEAALSARRVGRAGSLSSGLHHAHHGTGKGFCTFNGLALAARAALAQGAQSLLVLDLDAHCGGGTHELIGDDPRVWLVDVAVSSFDAYSPRSRHTLDIVDSPAWYLPTIAARLDELRSRAPRFDLCLYNAGMDPYEGCPIGGLPGITAPVLQEREQLVFGWCRDRGLPIAFVLAGGYTGPSFDKAELVALHRLTIAAAAA